MRHLASIREIKEILPHNNADSLELAIVDGWQVIVRKGEFSPGQKVIYFEIDSVLPVLPQFEFLRKSCHRNQPWLPNGEGFRLRTIKLRGEISQGLIVPISSCFGYDLELGLDITDMLGVVKWDPPVPTQLQGLAKSNFPSFISKTDQERIQNLLRELEEHRNIHSFEVTMKLDGSSFTCYRNEGQFGVCSRNMELKLEGNENNAFVKMFLESGLKDFMESIPESMNFAIQGELMGPGIQGNRENFTENRLYIFDVFDINNQRYMLPLERRNFINAGLPYIKNVFHVPVIHENFTITTESVADLLKMAEGPSINNPVREGLVWKCSEINFSFKTISNKFLLNEKD